MCAVVLAACALRAGAESADWTDPVHLVDPSLEFNFAARARALFLRGSSKFDEEPSEGDNVRLAGDLGLAPAPAGSVTGRVTYEGFGGELELAAARATGRRRLDRARAWNESHFSDGERVRTTLTWTTARLSFVWQSPDAWILRVEAGGGARWDRFALRLNGDGDNLGLVAPECGGRVLIPLGYRGGDFMVFFPGLQLDLRARAFALPGRRASASGWSASLGARVQLSDWLRVELGYSFESARFRRRDSIQHNSLSFTAHGPYFELTLNF